MLFLHCWNCDSLAVVAVAHFYPDLAGRHLAAIGAVNDCFVICSFSLLQTFSKTKFSLIPEVSRSLFVHSLHLQALVDVNTAFWIFQSDHSIQGSLINNKGFLLMLLLAAGAELIISDLDP